MILLKNRRIRLMTRKPLRYIVDKDYFLLADTFIISMPENVALEHVDFMHHFFSASFTICKNQTKGLI